MKHYKNDIGKFFDLIKLKLGFFFSLILFSLVQTGAQELVRNGSFEDHSGCPSGHGQIENATYWETAKNSILPFNPSPDYYHNCSSVSSYSVPNHPYWIKDSLTGEDLLVNGYQKAIDGIAYSGIFVYGNENKSREYIQTRLSEPLVNGRYYIVKFYVNLPDGWSYGSSGIGAHLSNTPLISHRGWINVSAHVDNPINNIITDTVRWTLISGKYQAIGGEQYLTIGNFHNDDETKISIVNPLSIQNETSYFFIDNVSLSSNNYFNAYPNPFNNEVTINVSLPENVSRSYITDALGRVVREFELMGEITNIQVDELPTAYYILNLELSSGEILSKKMAKVD